MSDPTYETGIRVRREALGDEHLDRAMIFVTVIGGIGTIVGPIVGTAIYFILQQTLARYGAWYLIVLGLVAIGVALWWPRGVWGAVSRKIHVRLFLVGYWLWGDDDGGGQSGGSSASEPGTRGSLLSRQRP